MAPSRPLALLVLTAASLVAADPNDPTCTTHPLPQLGKHMALVQLTNRLRSTGNKPTSTLTDFERDYIEDGRGPCCDGNRAECLSCTDDMALIPWCEIPEHSAVPGCENITTTPSTREGSADHSGAHRSGGHGAHHGGHGDAKGDGDADESGDTDSSGSGHGGANHSVATHGGHGGHGGGGGHGGHNDGHRRSTSTTSSTTAARTTTSPECVTREDPRVSAVGYTTSAPGTPCVFGVDARDEGSHCIPDDGAYGSFGWCYTSEAADSWGSCAESCPLFGPVKVLQDRIKHLEKKLAKAMATSTTTTTTVTTTEEPTLPPNTTTEELVTTTEEPSTTVTNMSTTLDANASANAPTNTSTNASANESSHGPGAKAAKSGGPGAKDKAGSGGHGPDASAKEG